MAEFDPDAYLGAGQAVDTTVSTPEFDPDQYLTTTQKVRVMSYGPVVGEHHHSAMFGPQGNKLEPGDVAVSPNLGLKLGDWIEVAGKPRRVADWSYIKPGQPTSNTVEIRDGPDQGYGTLRRLGANEIPKAMPVELQETRIEKAQPVKIAEMQVARAKPVNAEFGMRNAESKTEEFDPDKYLTSVEPVAKEQVVAEFDPDKYLAAMPDSAFRIPHSEFGSSGPTIEEQRQMVASPMGQELEKPVRAAVETIKGFIPTDIPSTEAFLRQFTSPNVDTGKYLAEAAKGGLSIAANVKTVKESEPFSQEWWNGVMPLAAQGLITAAVGKTALGKGPRLPTEPGVEAPPVQVEGTPGMARVDPAAVAAANDAAAKEIQRQATSVPGAYVPAPPTRTIKTFEDIPEEFVREKPPLVQREEKPLTKEEQAKREYEADLIREGEQTISDMGGMDILEAIRREGGFPAKGTSGYNMWKGELQSLHDMGRAGKQFGGTNVFTGKLFSKSARGVDDLLLRLRARGFDVETPGDLIERTITRLRSGRPDYALPEQGVTLYGEQAVLAKPKKPPTQPPGPELFAPEEQPFNLRGEELRQETTSEGAARAAAEARYKTEKEQETLFRPGAQQATLPRQISPQPALPVNSGVPVAEADIRAYLSQSLDIPIRAGVNVPKGMPGAAGLYRPKPETIRTKLRNDIPTIAHETGHYVHHLLFTDMQGRPTTFAGGFDTELMPLGRVTSKPNYSVPMVRKEGVAEFVREWLTDRSQAIGKAPKFSHYFENTLQRDFPQTWDIFAKAREDIAKFIAQPGWEKARSRIVFDPQRPRATFRQWLSRKYTDWFDELAPIDRTMRQLTEFGLDPVTARRVSERAINYKGGWRGKAEFDLEFEQSDINGKRVGPGLKTILKGLDTKELGDFSTYMALKRAEEKVRQGVRTGFEAELTDAAVRKRMSDLAPRFEQKRQQLIQFSENALRLLGDSGFFSPDQLAQIRAANRDYVPFYRIYEGVKDTGVGPRGSGKSGGFVNTSSGVLRMKGSDRQIIDPLESIIKNNYAFRDLAERNRIGREFVAAVAETQGGGRVGESVIKPVKPTKISHEEIAGHLEKLGLDESDIKSLGDDIGMTLWRATNGISPRDGVFRVWENGRERLFQVDDGDLLRALTLADSADASVIRNFPLFKPFAAVTKMLRTGATLTPEFMARNPFRDQITGAIFSKYGFVPFFDGFRGMLSVLRKDGYYQDWIKSGGRYAGLYDIEGPTMRKTLERAIRDPKALEMAWSWVQHPLQTLGAISGAFEQATRVGEFARAIKAGADPVTAANASKDVTLNFSRAGLKGKIVNQLMAFFNAGLQDLDKMVRAHREAPVGTATKAFMYITVPSVLTWALGKDDPKIQNLPEWRKSFFWNVNIGGNVFSLPKPFLLGALYGTSVEKALDYANGRDPNAVMKALSAIYQVGSPARGDMIAATNAFKPLVENISNYSFFMGRPLVGESQSGLSPGMQFNPTTSETAKFVGKTLNVSPIKIDNLIRGYLGGLGKYGTDAVDWFMLKAQGGDTPAPPAKDISQYPLIRGFMKQPYEASEYVQRFYKAMDTAETRLNDFRAYGQQLDTPGMRGFLGKNRDELAWYNAGSGETTTMGQLRSIRDNMSDINKAMVAIQQSRSISSEEKARRLILLGETRDKLAEIAFKTFVHPTDRAKVF